MNSDEIPAICAEVLSLAPKDFPPDRPVDPNSGQPEWYRFENTAWAKGEQVRQLLVANPKLRRDNDVQALLLDVVEAKNLRRGRQSFFFSLGHVSAAQHAPRVAALLSDPDVQGHALSALLKMKAYNFGKSVEPLIASPFTWIRKLAKQYLSRASSA